MFRLGIATDNAAFEGETRNDEIARILRALADEIVGASRDTFPLRDANGNTVGRAEFTTKPHAEITRRGKGNPEV